MNIVVIIPTHNDSEYLERAVLSCKRQSIYVDILVVDDCSTWDHRANIITLGKKYDFWIMHNQINYGLAGSRNKGIEFCNHEAVICLDCDDYLYDDVLDHMSIEIIKNDIVYGNITHGSDEDLIKLKAWPNTWITKESFSKENPLFCTSMFTRTIWQKAGGYPMFPYSIYEDYAFWCKCQSVGAKFKYIDKLIYHHTNRGDSMLSELHSKTNEYKELSRKGLDYSINKNCFRTI